ncbi:MAG: CRTAC1 family protein [Crocinitomicaceae bacterium]|nr:CRTAC1 family protein [Crocinitomicaceae bacterium]
MRWLIGILIICIAHLGYSQMLTDVALSQGITITQNTLNHYGNGMSFYDFDEDGWDDLTFPMHNDSIVFYKNVNGNFGQIGSMIYAAGETREILWVDYDNDDDLDLCLSYAELGMRLYQNDGSFNFTDVTLAAGISGDATNAYGVSFGDPDADGDLDIYLCNYSDIATIPVDHFNKYYINQGNGTFIESGIPSGIDNGLQTSFMGAWYDYDEDNDLDLHVINDRSNYADALFRNNNNGTFTDVAATSGVLNDGHNPMCISIADYNNDGYQDAFISDIASGTTTNGITIDFKLYENQNGGGSIDVAQTTGLDTNIMGWGGLWVDYDNDGFEDLYVPTSRLSPLVSTEETSLFYRNEQGNSFALINDSVNGDILSSSYAAVKGDINNDGFYDIVVLNDGVAHNVFENSGNVNNYIKITPVGTVSNHKAIGAKVKVYAGGINQYQTVMCGSGLCSQNSQHMIFGIGDNAIVDSVVVTFPSGIIVREFDLLGEANYTIVERAEVYVDLIPGITEITLCQGDSIIIGSTDYDSLVWNTGSTDSLITVSSTGIFSFVAENSAGDTLFRSTELTVTIEPDPLYQTVVIDPDCGAGNLGSTTLLFISPPSSYFNISWSNNDQGISMDSVGSGTYTYTMESMNSCIYTGSVTITESPEFVVQFITTPVTNDSLGAVEFFVFGGVPPFQFELNSVIEGAIITDLDSGNYVVIVTDANGCQVAVPFVITDESTNGLLEEMLVHCIIYSSKGSIWLSHDDEVEIKSITVRSITGEIVTTQDDGVFLSSNQWKSMHPLAQGIYLVAIEIEGNILVKRLFVN